jgi:hypothetical protein
LGSLALTRLNMEKEVRWPRKLLQQLQSGANLLSAEHMQSAF